MRPLHFMALVMASLLAAGCASLTSSPANEDIQYVRGALLFGEPSKLPLKASIDVYLLEASSADAPAEVIDRRHLENDGRSPVAFELSYDATAIDPDHTYTVRAAISLGKEFLYTADRRYPVITQGAGHYVSIQLVRHD